MYKLPSQGYIYLVPFIKTNCYFLDYHVSNSTLEKVHCGVQFVCITPINSQNVLWASYGTMAFHVQGCQALHIKLWTDLTPDLDVEATYCNGDGEARCRLLSSIFRQGILYNDHDDGPPELLIRAPQWNACSSPFLLSRYY